MTKPASQENELLPEEEEEAVGIPSFEMLVIDGDPVVSGSYFLHPPLRAAEARWATNDPTRLEVLADDGTEWYAVDVPTHGRISVVLSPVNGDHPAMIKAQAVVHLANDAR